MLSLFLSPPLSLDTVSGAPYRAELEQVSRAGQAFPKAIYLDLIRSDSIHSWPCRERQEQCCRVSHEAAGAGAGQNHGQALQQWAHGAAAARQDRRCRRCAASAQLPSCLRHAPALQVQPHRVTVTFAVLRSPSVFHHHEVQHPLELRMRMQLPGGFKGLIWSCRQVRIDSVCCTRNPQDPIVSSPRATPEEGLEGGEAQRSLVSPQRPLVVGALAVMLLASSINEVKLGIPAVSIRLGLQVWPTAMASHPELHPVRFMLQYHSSLI